MKRTIKTSVLFVLLVTCLSWMNCGDDNNPLAPSSLAGTWNFVSVTDKETNITTNAGDQVDLGVGVTGTISGTIVLTETTFTLTLAITPTGAQPVSFTASGTYSISGSTMTIVVNSSNNPEIDLGSSTATISRSGNRLTIEDVETRQVYEKQ